MMNHPVAPAEFNISECRRGVSIRCPCGRKIGVAWETDRGIYVEVATRPPELDRLDEYVATTKLFEPDRKARFPGSLETSLFLEPDKFLHPVGTHCERCPGRLLALEPASLKTAFVCAKQKVIAQDATT